MHEHVETEHEHVNVHGHVLVRLHVHLHALEHDFKHVKNFAHEHVQLCLSSCLSSWT